MSQETQYHAFTAHCTEMELLTATEYTPGTHQPQTSATFHIQNIWFFLPSIGYFSFFCKHWEGFNKVVLAGKVRDEGVFDAGLKFGKVNDYTVRKWELLKKSLSYYPLRNYRKFRFYSNYDNFVTGFGTQSLNSAYDHWNFKVKFHWAISDVLRQSRSKQNAR